MREVAVVFKKELRDALRDRGALVSALGAALMGPLLVAVLVGSMARQATPSGPVRLALAGGEQAPALVRHLEGRDVVVEPAPADVEAAVRSARVGVALVVPDDYARKLGEQRPAVLRLVSDPTRPRSREAGQRIQEILASYARETGDLRLLARGISPEVTRPLRVETVDVSTERSRAAVALGMLTVFLLVSSFLGGMSLASDATAGERERGSLEPLLLSPVRPGALALGKWLSASTLNAGGFAVTLGVCVAVLLRLPLEDLGIRLSGVAPLALAALAAGLPLALLAAGLQLCVAARSRSFRGGQTWTSLLVFLPMAAGMALELSRWTPAAWAALVPVLGQHHLFAQAFRGEAPGALAFAASGSTTLAAALVLVARLRSALSDETIVLA